MGCRETAYVIFKSFPSALDQFLLLKIVTEHFIKGITGLEPTKPLNNVSISKHDDIRGLKREVITAIETGNFPVAVFSLMDMAQALFNDDPFKEFRFWSEFALDDYTQGIKETANDSKKQRQ